MEILICAGVILSFIGAIIYSCEKSYRKSMEEEEQNKREMDAKLAVMMEMPKSYIEFEDNRGTIHKSRLFDPWIVGYYRQEIRSSLESAQTALRNSMEKGFLVNDNKDHIPTCNVVAARVKTEEKPVLETSGA